MCSNLVHFNYLVKILSETKNVHQVDFPIKCHGHQKAVLRIDIVAEKGGVWVKVVARNPKALNEIALGRSNYGTKTILDHARCYAKAAKENPHCFRIPEVYLHDFIHMNIYIIHITENYDEHLGYFRFCKSN